MPSPLDPVRDAAVTLAAERLMGHARREIQAVVNDYDGADELEAVTLVLGRLLALGVAASIHRVPRDRRDAVATAHISLAMMSLFETTAPVIRRQVGDCPHFTALILALRDLAEASAELVRRDLEAKDAAHT